MAEEGRRRDPAEAIADGEALDWESSASDPEGTRELSGYRLVADVAEALRALGAGAEGPTAGEGGSDAGPAPRRWGDLELRERLGRGGFGTVYRAFDPGLDREVALKLYHGAASGADDRFLAEARRLARVRHPNVLAVHGVDVRDRRAGLWADLVQGRSLAEWMEANGPLGAGEAVAIGADLCRALAAIHGAGLVHGDVKPSNVMREVGGRIVLMDFGAAREQAGDSEEPVSGTPVVTAPEVLRGEEPTPAADLYSLGVVLYYLVTGRYPLGGESVRSVREAHRSGSAVPLSDARPDLPPALGEVVERALDPDPGRRFASAGEMERSLLRSVRGFAEARRSRALRRWAALVSVLATVLLLVVFVVWTRRGLPEPSPARVAIALPPDAPVAVKPFPGAVAPAVALSSDGRRLGYVARTGEGTEIRVRDLGSDAVIAVPGTEGAYQVSFSPDGDQLLFGRGAKLIKAPVRGGGAVVLAEALLLLGAAWSSSGTVYFVPSPGSGVHAVPAAGGEARPVTVPDPESEEGHAYPEVLPGEEAILYVSVRRAEAGGGTRIVAQSLRTGEVRVLVEGATFPRYDPGGTLLYARGREVFAVGFDPERLEVASPARPLVSGLLVDPSLGMAPFDASESGVLAWVAGAVGGSDTSLIWIDRDGTTLDTVPAPPRAYLHPRLSPDGRRLVVETRARTDDLWLYDLERSTMTRLTFEGDNLAPVWTPDGARIAFSRHTLGPPNLYWMAADGTGEMERLTESERMQVPGSWSPDGRVLAFTETHPDTGRDLWLLPVGAGSGAEPFLRTPFDESHPAISPAGGWLAYTSDESGRPEVYLRPLAGAPAKRQVSSDGGSRPVWSRDGRELFFWSGDRLTAVAVNPRSDPQVGPPRELFQRRLERMELGANYDVAADGRLLGVEARDPVEPPDTIQLLLHWRGLLPAGR